MYCDYIMKDILYENSTQDASENRESKIVDLCEQRDDGTRTYMLVIAPEACEGGEVHAR